MTNEDISEIKTIIKKTYSEYNEPFVVAFSGGKDSTLVLDLVLESLDELYKETTQKITKTTYVISSNTKIENPFVSSKIEETFSKLKNCFSYLKIKAIEVIPDDEKTFWVSVIGKGYPLPLNRFRWCTRQLKIEPMNNAVSKILDSNTKIITVLGIRESESNSRLEKMNKYSMGDGLFRAIDRPDSLVFAPIYQVKTDELWRYAFSKKRTIWGLDYGLLYEMYWDTSKECPIGIEHSSLDGDNSSCGNSRWGCWMCPMSHNIWLDNIVENGTTELKPLADFRKWMLNTRDERENRYLGSHWIKKGKDGYSISLKRKGYVDMKINEYNDHITYSRPKKGNREKIIVTKKNNQYFRENQTAINVISRMDFENNTHDVDQLFSETGAADGVFVLKDNKLCLPAVGPYTLKYRISVLKKLLMAFVNMSKEEMESIHINHLDIITDEEFERIFEYWTVIAASINKEEYVKKEIMQIEEIRNQMGWKKWERRKSKA